MMTSLQNSVQSSRHHDDVIIKYCHQFNTNQGIAELTIMTSQYKDSEKRSLLDLHEALLIPPTKSYVTLPEKRRIEISRRLYTQQEVDQIYQTENKTDFNLKNKIKSSCSCTPRSFLTFLLSYFSIFNVIRTYSRSYIISDILAGLSAGFMHLPQGLGFGLLASLTPVYGLYTTFYPILLYVIFGTSPHVSFGTNAVLAVLTASIVEREVALIPGVRVNTSDVMSVTNSTPAGFLTDGDVLEYKVGVAMAVTFLAGIILLVMGFLRLGFLTSYLSVSFIGGFTTASAVHISTSQVGKMLNIKVKPYAGAGKLVKTYIDIFTNIAQTNVADLIISVVCIIVLLVVKICINERFKTKLKIPIPIDLLVVIIGTIISHFADFHGHFGVAIVGSVPTGIPAPRLPNMEAIPRVGTDSFVIAILAFALTISMAKLMARLNDYEVNDNQELVAYGMSNFVSSFFLCFPSCVAPPRTMILQSLGSKTTLNGIVSAIFILIVLLAAGPLFSSLPVAVLAAMIVVAMKELLLQVRNLPGIWRVSKTDFIIWLVTLLVSVLVDLDIGIAVGIGVSILTVIVSNQLSSAHTVGCPDDEQIFLDQSGRSSVGDLPEVKIFSFQSQLYFVNAERFKKLLYQETFNPSFSQTRQKTLDSCEETDTTDITNKTISSDQREIIQYIIIDCIQFTYIDLAGVNILKQVTAEFSKVGVEVFLARVPKYTLNTLDRADVFNNYNRNHVFFDLVDAVEATKKR